MAGEQRRWMPLLIVAGAGLIGYIATWLLFPDPLVRDRVLVPPLRGMPADSAMAALVTGGLRGRLEGELADPLVPRGTVSWSTPPAGTRLPEGAVVRLGLSTGVPNVRVPELVELDPDLAARLIAAAGLQVGAVDSVRDPAPSGTIIRTQPPGGTSVRAGSRVRLTVSLGRPATRD